MQEFKFKEYNTTYLYKINGYQKKRLQKEACFSNVFCSNINDNDYLDYEIFVYNNINNFKGKNYTPFTKNEIRRHIRLLNTLFPITVRVVNYKFKNIKGWLIKLYIKKQPQINHLYALTWVRYLYEYPYSVILMDAYRLKKDPKFRFESIATLFNICLECYPDKPRDIHQIPRNGGSNIIKLKELKHKILKVDILNNIYKQHNPFQTIKSKSKINNNLSIEDIEFWNSEELFEKERKQIYIDTYLKAKTR